MFSPSVQAGAFGLSSAIVRRRRGEGVVSSDHFGKALHRVDHDQDQLSGPHAFFGGLIHVRERAVGHRSGTDAVLLAACVPDGASGVLVDLGCGSGVVGLGVLARHQDLRAVLVDKDPSMAQLALMNGAENGLSNRMRVLEADVLAPKSLFHPQGLAEESADFVVSNPPFHPAGRVRVSPHETRATAHVLEDADLDLWIKTAGRMLKPKGVFYMIHRPDALPFLLQVMAGRFGDVRVKPVHGKAGRPATRVLIAGMKGSRAPFSLLEPLILHDEKGQRTEIDEAIARGRSLIAMG